MGFLPLISQQFAKEDHFLLINDGYIILYVLFIYCCGTFVRQVTSCHSFTNQTAQSYKLSQRFFLI